MSSFDLKRPSGYPVSETLDASNTSLSVPQFRVRVVRGVDAGAEVLSHEELLVVGKAEGVNLRLNDPLVSRLHLEMQATSAGVCVRDLGSKNGSFLGSTQFREVLLRESTTLSVGKTLLMVELTGAQSSVELSGELSFGTLWGDSQVMRRAFFQLRRASQVRLPVLLRGEVGTGKQEAARGLHEQGPTASGEFVIVDCASIPGAQIEQELFGESGAFEAARGGTLYLHEVGELPLGAQGQLLRWLEQTGAQEGGARLVSATSQDLQGMLNRREFRPELYYRLAALTISLPPLRERREDIPALVSLKLAELQAQGISLPASMQRELIEDVQGRSWPGNLRELRAFIEHFSVLGGVEFNPTRPEGDSDGEVNPKAPLREERERWNRIFEVRYLSRLLEQHHWNVVAAARAAGVEREYVHRLIKRHNLQRPR